eukprot:862451_1
MSRFQLSTAFIYAGHFLIYIILFIIIKLPSCSSSFLVGETRMPRAVSDMAIGYDHANNAILLIGGYQFTQYFAVFKEDSFTDYGNVFDSTDGAQGHGQFYTQLGNTLWMLNAAGTEIHAFDTNTYQMLSRSPSITVPIAESGLASSTTCLASIDDYLIVIGGGFHNVLDVVQIYHLTDDQWLSNIPSLNAPRAYSTCMVANNKVYAIGGLDDQLNQLDSIEVLGVWNMAAISSTSWYLFGCTLQKPRMHLRAALYGTDMIYVVGGEYMFNQQSSVDIINTVTDECLAADDLVFAIRGAPAIIVQNTLFVFGGYIRDLIGDDRYQYLLLATSNSTSPPSTYHPSIIPTNAPVPEPITTKRDTSDPTHQPTVNDPTVSASPAPLASMSPTYTPSTNAKEGEVRELSSTLNVSSEERPDKETKLQMEWIIVAVIINGVFVCCVCFLTVYYWFNQYRKNIDHNMDEIDRNANAQIGQEIHALYRKDCEDMMMKLTMEGNGEFVANCDSDEDDEILDAVNKTFEDDIGIDDFLISNDSDEEVMTPGGGNQAKPPIGLNEVKSMINSLNKVPLAALITKRDHTTCTSKSGANDKVLDEIEGEGEKNKHGTVHVDVQSKTTISSNTRYSERNAFIVKQITKGDAVDN